MSILYAKEKDAVNGLTIEGVECERSDDGGFIVPDIHVADMVTFQPLTDVRPEWLAGPSKGKRAEKVVDAPAPEPAAPAPETAG